MRQSLGRKPGERGGMFAQRQQKVRHRRRLLQAATVVIITKTECHDAPLAEKAVKLEFLERQFSESLGQAGLLTGVDQVRRIAEASRQSRPNWRRRRKQLEIGRA